MLRQQRPHPRLKRENDVGYADRSYLGRSDANALSAVDRPIPSCLADA